MFIFGKFSESKNRWMQRALARYSGEFSLLGDYTLHGAIHIFNCGHIINSTEKFLKKMREREERKKSMRNKRFKVFINWMDLYGAGKKNGKPITSFFFVQAAIFLVTVFYYINISHKRVCNFSIYLIQFVRDQIPSGWWAPAT